MSKFSFFGFALAGFAVLFLTSNLTAEPDARGKAGQGANRNKGNGGFGDAEKGGFPAKGGFGEADKRAIGGQPGLGGKGGDGRRDVVGGQGGFGGFAGARLRFSRQCLPRWIRTKMARFPKRRLLSNCKTGSPEADLNSDGFIDQKEQAVIIEKAKQMAAQGFGGQGGFAGFGGKGGEGGGFEGGKGGEGGFRGKGFGAKAGEGGAKPKRPQAE